MAETKLKSQQAFGGDGWQSANESWSYASASTITVPSGAASKYQKGDRIKFTQTTVKYGVIVAVADTLLTIAVNTDYTVANAAITANYYSHEASPLGFPGTFNFTPGSIDWNGTDPTTPTTIAQYQITGSMLTFVIKQTNTGAGTTNTQFQCSIPVNCAFGTASKVNGSATGIVSVSSDSGVQPTIQGLAIIYGTTTPFVICTFSSVSAYHVWLSGSYPI